MQAIHKLSAAALAMGLLVAAPAEAKKAVPAAPAPLKVCSAENELPYSDRNGNGFENKLAELVGKELGRPIENVWWTDARYFVRDLLEKGQCDVVMGVDKGDPRLLTTDAYYRSGYVFVYPKDKAGQFNDWSSPALQKAKQIAFLPDTPPDLMLKKIGRFNDMFNYMHSLVDFKSRRNQYVRYDMERVVNEVASGKAEVAAVWAPAAARYVHGAAKPLGMTVIPDNNSRSDGAFLPHHYSSSMGVRKNDSALLRDLNRVIRSRSAEITALLQAEGIPLLPLEDGQVASNQINQK
jgi:mxaJ protein